MHDMTIHIMWKMSSQLRTLGVTEAIMMTRGCSTVMLAGVASHGF